MLRRDPEVMLIGEVRDATTVDGVATAAAHRASGVHHVSRWERASASAGCWKWSWSRICCGAVFWRSSINDLSADSRCSVPGEGGVGVGLQVDRHRVPHGCERCRQTGYQGRAVAEMIVPGDGRLGTAILAREQANNWKSARGLRIDRPLGTSATNGRGRNMRLQPRCAAFFGWNRGPLAGGGDRLRWRQTLAIRRTTSTALLPVEIAALSMRAGCASRAGD